MALSREWLLGNGLGGSASGTAAGAHTRAEHAHLVAAAPHGRLTTLLLKLEERLHTDEGAFALATDLQPRGGARPAGYRLLVEFRLDAGPVWRFRAGGVLLEKSLFMIYGHNAVAIIYRQLDGPAARLTVSPLVTARAPLATRQEIDGTMGAVQGIPGRVRIEAPGERSSLTLWHNGIFMPARARQRVHLRPSDAAEGRDTSDEAFVPGYIEAPLSPQTALHVVASAEGDLLRALAQEDRLGSPPPRTLAGCIAVLEADERERRSAWRRTALAAAALTARQAAAAHAGTHQAGPRAEPSLDERDPWIAPLAETLRLGLVRRGRRLTLIASLPGSAERGAETLRAVSALVALRGFEAAREVLRGYVEYLDEGLAPEGFDTGDGRPRYGDPTVALWLVIAAERYARRSHDLDFAKNTLYPALEGVMHFYRSGTRHGIRVDADGLLTAGEGSEASKRADLNALWHHATVAMAQLARSVGRRENGAFYLAWANEHLKRFNEVLWDDERGRLFTALGPRGAVVGFDPTQLLAISVPPPLLPPERAARLVAGIERELFTPFGLRTAPGDATVGTAWLGAFCAAHLRAHGRSMEAQARVRAWLDALRAWLDAGAAHLLPEAFEIHTDGAGGIEPARAAGEPLSILAAAEILRFWVEELDHAPAPVSL